MTPSPNAEQLRRRLTETGNPFEVHGPQGDDQVHAHFLGPFNGGETVWNAHIMTLESIARATSPTGDPHDDGSARVPPPLRQFIEIGPATTAGRSIIIGLDVPRIDRPTLLKTVTMVQNYKRLRHGRIEWGAPHRGTHR